MPRIARFILALLLALALLAWAASAVVNTTAREWFERDVSSRAQLVLAGARQSLANVWYANPKDLQKQLMDLMRDDRVMGAAVCDIAFMPRGSTPGFPADFNCWTVGARVRSADPVSESAGRLQEWSTVAALPTGRVQRYLETRIDREHNAVVMRGHRTLIRPYPIALEWPVRWVEKAPSPEECRAQVWRDLGLKPDALLGVGVDRLDYTKGIEERFLAVELLLERYAEFRGRFSFAQLAAPSRTKIERYRKLNETVEHLADRINQRFGKNGYRPIILFPSHHEPPEVFRFFRAADLCYVSSLHDGMNLVAKEFVAAREDLKGVLVLSEFTGAARELTEALIVNPYDLEGSSDALAAALTMPPEEQRDRMRSMRPLLAQFNVYRWAGKMLMDASRLRNQERVAGRLAERSNAVPVV